ncbi:Predicted acyltransferase, LPLAT superfamily [Flavobacteriaceae bacterium MAR_2010_188]|nr:Predicted acyltransferase, LPLAT superfamily [Flavobacteriaceae bacterium MAR_2010_188]
MAREWDGKTRGTVFGFKIFIFFIKYFGVNAAYFLMHLPVPYFYIVERQNSKGLYNYFRNRLAYSSLKSAISVYRSYFEFGKTLVDRLALLSGMRSNYTFEFDGEEFIKQALAQQKGGILISGHVGNFELAQYFFNERLPDAHISIVISDQDHENIKEYLQQYLNKDHAKLIVVKDDMSHIFEINSALNDNRIVCISGDRYMEGTKFIDAELLGKVAKFPVGPFHLAARLDVPVLFVYLMRERNKHYHLYARTVETENKSAEKLLIMYCRSVENILTRYPLQWFNFYDFWEDNRDK